ncbi:MmcQ/YjbR family DNA-binding protein [Sandaracinus amylolyticus]|uniref:MmcQ/YjbR family DNA-binding protein n=1 Tax=Sandaracinus amylolyticus TaxID=927083 RepID=UPI001F208316|nr:MmcQ/YjbR family DNA-binding protein [Sandaracinus amylolyticus]UJR78182.1 putative DNA-binding protein, MmcQ/YjbR family [Sandaracinus amylolyticus]
MHPTTEPPAHIKAHEETIRAKALAYPGTHEDRPWDHAAFKVKNKTFCFLFTDATGLSLSMKLPESNNVALMLPFAQPTGYGLGKSGWVSAKFGVDDDVPIPMLLDWLDESYRAVAPKTLVKTLASGAVATTPAKPTPTLPTPKKAVAKKAAAKKAPVKKAATKKAAAKKR